MRISGSKECETGRARRGYARTFEMDQAPAAFTISILISALLVSSSGVPSAWGETSQQNEFNSIPSQPVTNTPSQATSKTKRKPKKKKKVFDLEESEIPKNTTAPPALITRTPVDRFVCKRTYIYQGKTLNCDSNLRWDGENLRTILLTVPPALTELDLYQKSLNKVDTLAYVATAGLAIAGIGTLVSSSTAEGPNQIVWRNRALIGGLTIAGGAFSYGLGLLNHNDIKVSTLIYPALAGIALAAAGGFLADKFAPCEDETCRKHWKYIIPAVGVTITASSLFYGFGISHSGNFHLGNAVKFYNEAHPENPLELQFATGARF